MCTGDLNTGLHPYVAGIYRVLLPIGPFCPALHGETRISYSGLLLVFPDAPPAGNQSVLGHGVTFCSCNYVLAITAQKY